MIEVIFSSKKKKVPGGFKTGFETALEKASSWEKTNKLNELINMGGSHFFLFRA